MRITALVENTSAHGLPAEHGLSLLVEANGCRCLFDTGKTGLFEQNADALGIDLDQVDFAVISHGHYDHGGGIGTFLKRNSHAPVWMSSYAFEPHYNALDEYIGLDPALQDSDRIRPVSLQTEIAPGFTLCPCRDAKRIWRPDAFGLKMAQGGALVEDDFRHEQYLLVEEYGKRVLFSGCSHRGILNIMHWFRPDVLVGGFHFFKLPADDTLDEFADALNACPAEYYTCHCTGFEQYEYMKQRMPRLHYLGTGESVTLFE